MQRHFLSALLACLPSLALAVSFSNDLQPEFNNRCVACHMTGLEEGALALVPGQSHAALVNRPSTQAGMPRVTPGDPAHSYLLHKLQGTHLDQGGQGARMPMGGAPVPEALLDALRTWISQGAPDN